MNTDISTESDIWIENDGVFGPTAGDTIVHPGDQLNLNVIVELGYCQEW